MNIIKKLTAIAAFIVALLLFIVVFRRIPNQDVSTGMEPPVRTVETVNALYMVMEQDEAKTKHGVSADLSAESIGELICHLDRVNGTSYVDSSYKATSRNTDITLHTVKTLRSAAVAILQDGKDYVFVRIDHPYWMDHTQPQLFGEIFSLYGIESGKDIVSISHVDSNGKLHGTAIQDETQLEQFYTECLKMEQCSEDEFYHTYVTSSDQLKSQQQAKRLEKDRGTLCIEAKNGLRFYLDVYDKRGWICSTMTDTCFKMTDPVRDLLL